MLLGCDNSRQLPKRCPANVDSLATLEQTGTILIPDGVTTILNLMTGMGLLGVAAVVSAAASRFSASPSQPTRTSDCQRSGRICSAHHPKPMRVSLRRALHCARHSFLFASVGIDDHRLWILTPAQQEARHDRTQLREQHSPSLPYFACLPVAFPALFPHLLTPVFRPKQSPRLSNKSTAMPE